LTLAVVFVMAYSWESLNCLLQESGGSAYILDVNQLIDNFKLFNSSISSVYQNVAFGYSYKTNCIPRLCYEASKLGLYAEVVSGAEYLLAKHLGILSDQIIFNGPGKTENEIRTAVLDGAIINIDSLSEAHIVDKISAELEVCCKVGLRCNSDIISNKIESRFGLSLSSGELQAANSLLNRNKFIDVSGLHYHSSYDRSPESYKLRVEKLIETSDLLFKRRNPDFIDIGGGFCGPMDRFLSRQLTGDEYSFSDYAHALGHSMKSRYGQNGPTLILEPGVGLVGNVLKYAFRIDHIKKIGHSTCLVTSGSSLHIKIVPNKVNLPMQLFQSPKNARQSLPSRLVDLAGFTCLEYDILQSSIETKAYTNDIFVASNCGAYSYAIAPDFIRPSPMVYEYIGSNEFVSLTRKKSHLDLIHSFEV